MFEHLKLPSKRRVSTRRQPWRVLLFRSLPHYVHSLKFLSHYFQVKTPTPDLNNSRGFAKQIFHLNYYVKIRQNMGKTRDLGDGCIPFYIDMLASQLQNSWRQMGLLGSFKMATILCCQEGNIARYFCSCFAAAGTQEMMWCRKYNT